MAPNFKSPSTSNAATEPPASRGLAISSPLALAVSYVSYLYCGNLDLK